MKTTYREAYLPMRERVNIPFRTLVLSLCLALTGLGAPADAANTPVPAFAPTQAPATASALAGDPSHPAVVGRPAQGADGQGQANRKIVVARGSCRVGSVTIDGPGERPQFRPANPVCLQRHDAGAVHQAWQHTTNRPWLFCLPTRAPVPASASASTSAPAAGLGLTQEPMLVAFTGDTAADGPAPDGDAARAQGSLLQSVRWHRHLCVRYPQRRHGRDGRQRSTAKPRPWRKAGASGPM